MRARAWLLASLLCLQSSRASASIFGEENAALWELVALQAREINDVAQLLANIKIMAKGVNDVAGGVRHSYRVYETLKNYSARDLVADATRGLREAFPELEELGLLYNNVSAIEQGRVFSHRDYHDRKMSRLFDAGFRRAYRATIWPKVFGDALDENKVERTEVDDLILERFNRSGQALRVAMQDTALQVLVSKTDTLMQDAEAKGRTDLQSAALTAQLGAQNLNNTTRLRDLSEQEAALREHHEQITKQRDEALRNALAQHVNVLTLPPRLER